LPEEFRTAIEIVSLCTSNPIYFTLSIEGVLSGGIELNTQNPTPKGAPFYIASRTRRTKVVLHRAGESLGEEEPKLSR
jgi:hypothetical protein